MAFDRDDNQPRSATAPEKAAPASRRRRFTTRTQFSSTPMSSDDLHAVEHILAELVARAYAADHPELFRRHEADMAGHGKGEPDSA